MFDVHEKLEDHFSLEVLADILSLPKRSIESRINKGDLEPCPKTGLISKSQVIHFPEIKRIHESKWDEELTIKPNRPYKLIELFAGGGGLALGMEQAGFESVLLNEMDKHACSTLRHNRPDWNVVEGDISKVDFTKIKDVDVLTGGFPCQAFSYAGKSLGFEDTRGTLFFEMARAIKETQPKIFMAENVRALLTHENGRTLETIKNVIDELGYTLIVEPKVIKAIFYKVPQKRERLILVGVRKDLVNKAKFAWPSPYKRVMTLTDAFKKGELFESDVMASPGQKYPKRKKEILGMVRQGGYWRDIDDIEVQKEYMQKSFYLGGGKTGMARRLSMDEPSLTLTTSPAQKQTERCHPLETRPLQSKEYARIQTFPDNWEFQGPLTAVYKQIGNAVPVNMAAALGRSLVRLLNDLEA